MENPLLSWHILLLAGLKEGKLVLILPEEPDFVHQSMAASPGSGRINEEKKSRKIIKDERIPVSQKTRACNTLRIIEKIKNGSFF
jgi:hypothetical protein